MEHLFFPKISSKSLQNLKVHSGWVATEKIHGAQFVIGTDGKNIRYGKRKAWLNDEDSFFGWQILRGDFETAAEKIYSIFSSADAFYIYGELFGGKYPHHDVTCKSAFKPVQTGIWYTPELKYAVFDIVIVKNNEKMFISHTDMEKAVLQTSLKSVPKLGVGNYEKLIYMPVKYPSTVYRLFGLPEIENNFAEGFVLKPDLNLPYQERPVVKFKIPEFNENRFDESCPFNPDYMPGISEILELIPLMVNSSRIESARSKVGESIDMIIEESVLDVLIDLGSVFPLRMSSLSDSEDNEITDTISELVTKKLNIWG